MARDTEPKRDLPRWAHTLTNAGIAGAVLWYVGNSLIPTLLDINRDTLRTFQAEMSVQREHDAKETSDQRQHDDDRTRQILDAIARIPRCASSGPAAAPIRDPK